jgi:hypothetical protein
VWLSCRCSVCMSLGLSHCHAYINRITPSGVVLTCYDGPGIEHSMLELYCMNGVLIYMVKCSL